MRPFSLRLYLLVVFACSWPFQIVGTFFPELSWPLNVTSMCMVSVGTFLAGKYLFRDGFATTGWSKGSGRSYAIVFGLICVLWIAPAYLIDLLSPYDVSERWIGWGLLLSALTLVPGFGEEFGWRGYMLPHLMQQMSARKAVNLHAIIWWAWHLPVLAGAAIQNGLAVAQQQNTTEHSTAVMAITSLAVLLFGLIPAAAHAIVIAFIWYRSRSVWVATTYHALYDGVRDAFSVAGSLHPGVMLWVNLLFVALAGVILWKVRWEDVRTPANS